MVAKAENGTLFLDEIGDLGSESQIKLLRLLQEREYYPLGADLPRQTTARFVFATNLDVSRDKGGGTLRKDLLYRLMSHQIRIPPLRERKIDLPPLVEHFLDKASRAVGKNRPTVPRELISLLRVYPFPGNVRELEGLIVDAMVRHRSRVLSLKSFRSAIAEREANLAGEEDVSETNVQDLFGDGEAFPTLKKANEILINEALRRSEGNQDAAARLLGLTRSALNKRLNRNR
jgi:transcriptional regulator with PAS, ATPase and Fis domain